MIAREEADNDYFGKWYTLFDETFLERDLYLWHAVYRICTKRGVINCRLADGRKA